MITGIVFSTFLGAINSLIFASYYTNNTTFPESDGFFC